jgi:hypothetical protein
MLQQLLGHASAASARVVIQTDKEQVEPLKPWNVLQTQQQPTADHTDSVHNGAFRGSSAISRRRQVYETCPLLHNVHVCEEMCP